MVIKAPTAPGLQELHDRLEAHRLRQPAKAREAFQRALRLAPAMPEAAENLAALRHQDTPLDRQRLSRHTEDA